MTSTSTPLTEAETQGMSTAELRINLERCARLIDHPSLLQRLPDHGEGIRHRHVLFTKEVERREIESAKAKTTTDEAPPTTEALERRRRDNETAQLAEASKMATSPADAAREIGEKYKHCRVSVEDTVRRMYEGVVSEAEVQRIVQSVPPSYFLTYEETCAMERRLAKEARRAELQKLAAESARQSLKPQ
ncbi:hypothetical protein ABL78_6178 [Leptomonas seymouri]|uniref:Uncharacterized protein n=1 Tax=Leptomonas seymouri TaxID=5684 RepID=A0A0N1I2F7_LEPSE|nr:hypothetical protein ABL78_6178 [Leptomonas seymouri]|eukprot:KPI84760.1 hypothetical protein ABL78_6178 [Leptomonas seymouri]